MRLLRGELSAGGVPAQECFEVEPNTYTLRGTPVSLMEKKICSEQISAAGGRVLA